MKNCSMIRPELSAYMDGELSPQVTLEVQDHVSECSICGGLLEGLQTAREEFATFSPTRVSADFARRVHRKAEPPRSSRRSRARGWISLAFVACVAVAFVGSRLQSTERHAPERITVATDYLMTMDLKVDRRFLAELSTAGNDEDAPGLTTRIPCLDPTETSAMLVSLERAEGEP